MFSAYQGIYELLKNLKKNGYLIGVATLKGENFAKQMLEKAGLSKYFDAINGWYGTNDCTKACIIKRVISSLSLTNDYAILVGDSEYDAEGAKTADVDFLGVSYGFGIKKSETENLPYPIVHSPKDIFDYISNTNKNKGNTE